MDPVKFYEPIERDAHKKLTLTVKQLAEMLGISENKAREFTRIQGFPCINVGRKRIILIEPLNDWLRKYAMEGAGE